MNPFVHPRAFALLAGLTVALPPAVRADDASRADRKARAAELRGACRDDFTRFCGGVRPGGGHVVSCLQDHVTELSPTCQQVLTETGARKGGRLANPGHPGRPATTDVRVRGPRRLPRDLDCDSLGRPRSLARGAQQHYAQR